MALTLTQVLTAREFHYGECTRTVGPRGGVTVSCEVWRRNGATKTWKRRPSQFRIPVKHGLYRYGEIRDDSAKDWHAAEDCPVRYTSN